MSRTSILRGKEMSKQKKMNSSSRTGKNHENGNGLPSETGQTSATDTGKDSEFEKLVGQLAAGEFDSDSNLQLLFQEYQKVLAGTGVSAPDEATDILIMNRKLTRQNHQLHLEISILKTELENMKASHRQQVELEKLVETYKTALAEKEALLQELDQRLQFLSLRLQEIPLLALAPENSGYRVIRARMLAHTILPDFYKKRLSMELDLIEKIDTGEADSRLLELNLMRELIYYHENELKQLLKN